MEPTLRLRFTVTLPYRVSDRFILGGAPGGNSCEKWHPSYQYYRRAQVTDDLADAYRNMFLALESLLSAAVGKDKREGERRWLARALRIVNARDDINLTQFATKENADAVDAIVERLYRQLRNETFHAKQDSLSILPNDENQRAMLRMGLRDLSRLYLEVLPAANLRRPRSGALAPAGFQMMTDFLDHDTHMLLTDDNGPNSPDDQTPNPNGGRLINMDTRLGTEWDRPFCKHFFAEIDVAKTAGLSKITKVALVHEGTPVCWENLDFELELRGLRRLQVLACLSLINANLPRVDYVT